MLVLSLFAAASATAAAQTYTMTTGVWGRGDGYEVDVPFVGKAPDNCDFLKFGLNKSRPEGSFLTKVIGKQPQTIPGFMTKMALPYGCPSGMGKKIVATAPGTGGAFTLPATALSRPMFGYLVAVPLPDSPQLVQAATSGLWRIPYATRNGMGTQGGEGDAVGSITQLGVNDIGGTMRQPLNCCDKPGGCVDDPPPALPACTNLAPFRRFMKSAWNGGPAMTFNGQTGRVGANFTWCWGNPGCTTIAGGTQKLIVRYTAGPNRFGGTSNQIVNTGIVGSLFIDLGNEVDVEILDAGMGAIQVEGRGYADFITDYLPPAKDAFSMVMVAPVYQMALHRMTDPIGQPQLSLITAVTGPMAAGPPFSKAQRNQKFGFPLTTGTVIARDTNPPYLGAPVATLTAMGGDVTTAMGARNISLVTGTLARLDILPVKTAGISQMFLPEPSHTGQLLAGVAALFGVAAWRSRRARAGRGVQRRRGSRP